MFEIEPSSNESIQSIAQSILSELDTFDLRSIRPIDMEEIVKQHHRLWRNEQLGRKTTEEEKDRMDTEQEKDGTKIAGLEDTRIDRADLSQFQAMRKERQLFWEKFRSRSEQPPIDTIEWNSTSSRRSNDTDKVSQEERPQETCASTEILAQSEDIFTHESSVSTGISSVVTECSTVENDRPEYDGHGSTADMGIQCVSEIELNNQLMDAETHTAEDKDKASSPSHENPEALPLKIDSLAPVLIKSDMATSPKIFKVDSACSPMPITMSIGTCTTPKTKKYFFHKFEQFVPEIDFDGENQCDREEDALSQTIGHHLLTRRENGKMELDLSNFDFTVFNKTT